jgi:hypothetical protein
MNNAGLMNQINQINKTNQMNQTNKTGESTTAARERAAHSNVTKN